MNERKEEKIKTRKKDELTSAVGEAEDDVVDGLFAQVREQLLEAVAESQQEPLVVRLQQQADGVQALELREILDRALEVLLVLGDSSRVAKARRVDDSDAHSLRQLASILARLGELLDKLVGLGLLGGGLALF